MTLGVLLTVRGAAAPSLESICRRHHRMASAQTNLPLSSLALAPDAEEDRSSRRAGVLKAFAGGISPFIGRIVADLDASAHESNSV